MAERTYTVLFERDPASGRYTATVSALDCLAEGDTLDQARVMVREMMALEIEAHRENGLPIIPAPDPAETP